MLVKNEERNGGKRPPTTVESEACDVKFGATSGIYWAAFGQVK
jgi:hypothetical protein